MANGKNGARFLLVNRSYLLSGIKNVEKANEHLKNGKTNLAVHQLGNALQMFKALIDEASSS